MINNKDSVDKFFMIDEEFYLNINYEIGYLFKLVID